MKLNRAVSKIPEHSSLYFKHEPPSYRSGNPVLFERKVAHDHFLRLFPAIRYKDHRQTESTARARREPGSRLVAIGAIRDKSAYWGRPQWSRKGEVNVS